jgi:hypothetical protein
MPTTEIVADAAATSLYICSRAETAKSRQGTTMTDREKILATLREKPMKVFDVMKRVNITNQDSCQDLLLKMRDDGVVRFDIHKGVWIAV